MYIHAHVLSFIVYLVCINWGKSCSFLNCLFNALDTILLQYSLVPILYPLRSFEPLGTDLNL